MSIVSATIDQKYAAKAKCSAAELALEAHTLVSNPANIAAADAACSAAYVALAAASADAVVTGSTVLVVKSGVEFLAPAITGTYVNGYTLTIVNGLVTAIVAS